MAEVSEIESLLEGLKIGDYFLQIMTHEIPYFCKNVKSVAVTMKYTDTHTHTFYIFYIYVCICLGTFRMILGRGNSVGFYGLWLGGS